MFYQTCCLSESRQVSSLLRYSSQQSRKIFVPIIAWQANREWYRSKNCDLHWQNCHGRHQESNVSSSCRPSSRGWRGGGDSWRELHYVIQLQLAAWTLVHYAQRIWTPGGTEVEIKRQQGERGAVDSAPAFLSFQFCTNPGAVSWRPSTQDGFHWTRYWLRGLPRPLLHIHLFDDFAFPALLLVDDSHVRSRMPMRSSAYGPLRPITACISLKAGRVDRCGSRCWDMLWIGRCTAAAVRLTLRLRFLFTRQLWR